jgi:hypothetical protein
MKAGDSAMKLDMEKIELWDAGGDSTYFYTEHPSIFCELSKEFPHYSTYFKGKHICGWQFLVPNRIVPFLKMKYHYPG